MWPSENIWTLARNRFSIKKYKKSLSTQVLFMADFFVFWKNRDLEYLGTSNIFVFPWFNSMPYVSHTAHSLCVEMDFTRTFQASTKCNNKNSVWSHLYQILVVLKHHRRLWANIFDTDISRSISKYPK